MTNLAERRPAPRMLALAAGGGPQLPVTPARLPGPADLPGRTRPIRQGGRTGPMPGATSTRTVSGGLLSTPGSGAGLR